MKTTADVRFRTDRLKQIKDVPGQRKELKRLAEQLKRSRETAIGLLEEHSDEFDPDVASMIAQEAKLLAETELITRLAEQYAGMVEGKIKSDVVVVRDVDRDDLGNLAQIVDRRAAAAPAIDDGR